MEGVQVDFTDVSAGPSSNKKTHDSAPGSNARGGKYNVNRDEDNTSCLQSIGKKRLIIAISIAVTAAIVIILAIVLSVVLTRKSNAAAEQASQAILLTRQQILTKCQPAKSTNSAKTVETATVKTKPKKLKISSTSKNSASRVLVKNTYIVEFATDSADKNHFRTVTKSLELSHNIQPSVVKKRRDIHSSLFSGVSFTVTDDHPIEAIEMIKDAIAAYPVYTIQAPEPIKSSESPGTLDGSGADWIRSYNLTGVTQAHERLQSFGKGVRVAVIDTGIYYLHPALGGCFGKGCKVEFGYDFVGDIYGISNQTSVPDGDPLDNCSDTSHGTHVAGIIAANATGMNQTGYIPYMPFIGVAPQVTLGAYRVFGCNGDAPSDAVTEAIYRAYDDKADIINLSLGDATSYPESIESIAIQRVVENGVYVVVAGGNSGGGGLQTLGNPSISPSAMAVASIDNTYNLNSYAIIAPDGSKILYEPGHSFGGWKSIVNSTIVVNNPNATANDGCSGPSKAVSGTVVLFYMSSSGGCTSATRCNLAATAGAIGCLIYNIGNIAGSSTIPSGSISAQDGLKIIATVNANPSAIYMFTDLLEPASVGTAGTVSSFSSLGLSADLLFKPQISGIGGYVYSTISPHAAQQQKLTRMYGTSSGTSMACPFVVGTLALFLASIGNPAPNTTSGYAADGICRPNFSVVTDIFQSTAKIVNIYNSSLFASTVQQGAGLADAYKALTSTTMISPSQLSLNDTVRKTPSYTIKVFNIGDQAAVYNVSHGGAALTTGKAANDDQLMTIPLYTADYANVFIEPTTFELKPQDSLEIMLRFEAPPNADPALLPIYSGFIYVTNQVNGEVVHASYAGVAGNYARAQIIVQNSPSGFITGIVNDDGDFISDGQLSNVNATKSVVIAVTTAWPTRLFFGEVVSADTGSLSSFNSSYGLIRSQDNSTLYYTDQARNTAVNTQTFPPSNSIIWYGYVCLDVSNQNCSNNQPVRLASGEYRIRFSALKHFGNITNPNDFEAYYTPVFNLVY